LDAGASKLAGVT